MKLQDYAIRIELLPREDGGGFLVTVPDLPGCVADGNTVDAAIAEAFDAFPAWTAAEEQDKRELPAPKPTAGQLVQRIPTRRSGGPQATEDFVAAIAERWRAAFGREVPFN